MVITPLIYRAQKHEARRLNKNIKPPSLAV
jgi:hypothetical protein